MEPWTLSEVWALDLDVCTSKEETIYMYSFNHISWALRLQVYNNTPCAYRRNNQNDLINAFASEHYQNSRTGYTCNMSVIYTV